MYGRKRVLAHLELESEVVQCGCWESNLEAPYKQYMLSTAEPSL